MAEPILSPEAQKQLIDAWVLSQAKGGSPTAPAPATQRFLVRWDENRIDETTGQKAPGFVFYDNPNYTPPKPTAAPGAVTGSQYGTWEPDPANPGQYRQVVPPQAGISDPNEARSKAIKAQTDEADRDRKIANERATGLYVDDKDLAAVRHAEATDQVAAARLKEDIRNNTARQKTEDDKLHLENQKLLLDIAKNPAEIAKLGAEAARLGAATDLDKAQIAALGIKTAADADRARAAGLLDQAQADRIKAELARGEAVTAPLDQPFLTRRNATGQLITEQNPNYQGPKAATTRGELAQRVALLQSQAAQMVEKIRADQSVPADQQSARFNQWYDQNIAPQIDALGQQQQSVIRDEALKNAEAQRQAFTAAAQYRAPEGYGRAFEQGLSKLAPGIDWSGSTTWKGPDLAASIPAVPEGMDFGALLGRGQWAPPGAPAPPPGAPPPAAPGTPAPAPAPAALTPEQIANRAAASAQMVTATGQGGGGVNGTGAPVAANPMAYAMLRQRLDEDAALQARQAAVPQPFSPQVSPAPVPVPTAPVAPPMPHAAALQLATGGGPLAYGGSMLPPPPVVPSSPGLVDDAAHPFANLIPYLPPGYDPRLQTNYAWPHLTP